MRSTRPTPLPSKLPRAIWRNISVGAACRPRTVSLSAARTDIQPTILSLAADESLDVLVMGGYGHSRLHERFLGGVTRAMLEAMTVPTLMSH